ncbi:MAG: methyltransferase domain-containing protein [Candidatus Lokiarchaeia archaeon]|nr:methyltransferase domain-containing protein [Candidatus Lokiarchaeia archaeon]
MKKKQTDFEKFHSQLDLPFLETDYKFIDEIIWTLKHRFGLVSNSKQKLIDLGAGNGSIVIFTALNHKIKSYGIEINHKLINEANSRIRSLKKEGTYNKRLFRNINLKLGDFYLLNLKNYDFVYIYLLPSMQKYLKHVFNTAKIGTIFISHKYPLEEFESLLKIEYRLEHESGEQKLKSFFYNKIA